MRKRFAGVVLAMAAACAFALAPKRELYASRDGGLEAELIREQPGSTRVQIHARGKRAPVAETAVPGYLPAHSEWTRDSQFFVVGMEAAGGHQPWAHPIWVYSRKPNRFWEPGTMGAMAAGDFALKDGDRLKVQVLDCARRDAQSFRVLTIRLRELAVEGRIPDAPCSAGR